MKILIYVFILLFIKSFALADQQLVEYCNLTGGEVVQGWTCPETRKYKSGEACKQTNQLGQTMYFNGCSAPEGKYKNLFFKACIVHDLCYHHEPTTNQKSKADCDNQFLKNMKTICKGTAGVECVVTAQAYYAAVVKGGDSSFACSKENVQYPTEMNQLPFTEF